MWYHTAFVMLHNELSPPNFSSFGKIINMPNTVAAFHLHMNDCEEGVFCWFYLVLWSWLFLISSCEQVTFPQQRQKHDFVLFSCEVEDRCVLSAPSAGTCPLSGGSSCYAIAPSKTFKRRLRVTEGLIWAVEPFGLWCLASFGLRGVNRETTFYFTRWPL